MVRVRLDLIPVVDMKELTSVLTLRAKVAGEISETRKHEGGVKFTVEQLAANRAKTLEHGLKQFGVTVDATNNRLKEALTPKELQEAVDESE